MSAQQHSLSFDESDPARGAVSGAMEVAWIESDRGRPLHVRRAIQLAAIERVFGRAFKSIVPSDDEWRDAVHPDDRQRVAAALAEGRRDGRFDVVYRLRLPDGRSRRVRDRILVLADRWQVRIVASIEGDEGPLTATIAAPNDPVARSTRPAGPAPTPEPGTRSDDGAHDASDDASTREADDGSTGQADDGSDPLPESSAKRGTEQTPLQEPGVPIERADPAAWLDLALDEAILRCDHAGRIVQTFGRADCLPADRASLIGRRVAEIDALPTPLRRAWTTALDRCLDARRAQIAAYRLDRGDGARAFEARMMPDGDAAVIVVRDVGERDRLRDQLAHLAVHDPLTGVGNLRMLRERLAAWMRPAGAPATTASLPVALLVIDLDRFKQTNDLHGRSVGDSLLRLAAQRIRREALAALRGRPHDAHDAAWPAATDRREAAGSGDREADRDRPDGSFDASTDADDLVVARLGGDQFAIACRVGARAPATRDAGVFADALATRLVTALGAPTRIAGLTLFVRSSIGAALHPDDAPDAATLLAQAEGAMKRAKLAGRNQARRRGDDGERASSSAAAPPAAADSLRDALAAGQFTLVYQPKFELATSVSLPGTAGARDTTRPGAMIAVEALLRWRVPGGPVRLPQDFLAIAETSGMIRPLGDWVLRTALGEAARFAADGGARVGVAVNVSLLQLHDRTFVATVLDALHTHGFAPGELTLELAETAFVDDVRLVADVVAELSAAGVRLAIDHFGVGSAGLVALKSLPIDEIKIDRSFVAGSAVDAFDATIVAGLVDMAHDLGKTVTAEGVERVDQIAALHRMRCDAIQGFFIGEPMTAAELVAVPSLWGRARASSGA